jgi:hypothetical protein
MTAAGKDAEIVYQELTSAERREVLRTRLQQAEREHYALAVQCKLFARQDAPNKEEVLQGREVLLAQAASAVRTLQELLRDAGDG